MVTRIIQHCQLWDTQLFETIFQRRGHTTAGSFFYLASRSADTSSFLILGLLLFIINIPQTAHILSMLALGFVIELPAYKVLKHAFKRARPCHILPNVRHVVQLPDQYSFPSGHTAAAFLLAALLSACWPVTAIPLYFWAAAVGYSRVYNGVHYPADVFAGMALGHLSARLVLFMVST